jgi:putative hydrolase of HD superfamily
MDDDQLVDLLMEAATLKRVPRTGWILRGVPRAESVADHSFGVGFVALALANGLNEASSAATGKLDVEKVLIMALLHDLAEVRLTDLPVSAVGLLSEGVKSQAEAQAIDQLLAPLPGAGRFRVYWQEFEDRDSPEGRLVRDADKIEMMVQCLQYEQAGSRGLDEFWEAMDRQKWHYELSAELYARLRARRGEA